MPELSVAKIIKWLGDDPKREGLKDTPRRVATRWRKLFAGYQVNLEDLLNYKGIKNSSKSRDVITIKDIEFISFCEHHLLPMIGTVDISYIPSKKLIGIGHAIKIVQAFAQRLQIQERMTAQIAEALEKCLDPLGVAVHVQAKHYCVDPTEAGKLFVVLETHCLLGAFKADKRSR